MSRFGKEKKICPVCKSPIFLIGLYWCNKCKKWYEEIDFLDTSKEEIDEDCKKCVYLTKTKFKKNNMPLFYCNCSKSERTMEKLRDFRKCIKIEYIGGKN